MSRLSRSGAPAAPSVARRPPPRYVKDVNVMNLKTLKLFVPICAAAALCGCGTPYSFSPYVGAQQNWQTGPGGYVKVVNKATLYPPGQYPARPYIIIGAVTTD